MPFVNVHGIDLHYTIDGTQGPWITLSHSLACNLSAWDAQAELLKKDFRVLRFDTRGHGLSSAPPGPYTLEELAADVEGLVNVAGHKGPLIVQGVQHLFHPPIELDKWPSDDHETRIVFITRGITEQTVSNLFKAIASVATVA